MKKQLAIAAGVLLTLGTAFSATVLTDARAATPASSVESASADVSSRATEQVVSMWNHRAESIGSTHLARPL
ncbi:MAG: hypothetical protein ACREV5_10755 [Steroidobacter sp.]